MIVASQSWLRSIAVIRESLLMETNQKNDNNKDDEKQASKGMLMGPRRVQSYDVSKALWG